MPQTAPPRPVSTVTPLATRPRSADPATAARQRTVELLCRVLREDPHVRAQWQRHVSSSGRGIHQAAIAMVLAEHQWATGEVSREHTQLPRRLKDTVSRALSGRTLSRRVLHLFIDAFAMDHDTATALWERWRGGRGDVRGVRPQRTRPQATQSRRSTTRSAMA
jgi:hypothetical protein